MTLEWNMSSLWTFAECTEVIILAQTQAARASTSLCSSSHCSKSSFFFQKFNFDFPRKIVELFWVKTRENAAFLDFLAVDNFDFTRKIVKKTFGVKNS